mgnify:CR=1 FL=1
MLLVLSYRYEGLEALEGFELEAKQYGLLFCSEKVRRRVPNASALGRQAVQIRLKMDLCPSAPAIKKPA